MKERSREMGLSLPTAEEIFRDYSAPRTDVVHSLTNDHHDSPLSPHPCRRGHITAVENTTIPSSCNKLGRENITILVWLLFKLVHYQQMDHVRESYARQIPNLSFHRPDRVKGWASSCFAPLHLMLPPWQFYHYCERAGAFWRQT
ncbi:uncharacterized protein [Malus domestica]|uniref:uncharacterized protein n=1 Tax=Malus domestica TaxID=3750 RepID=UPI003976B9C4